MNVIDILRCKAIDLLIKYFLVYESIKNGGKNLF